MSEHDTHLVPGVDGRSVAVALGVRAVSTDLPGAEMPAYGPVAPVPEGRDRSPRSLVLLLANAAERLRTDPVVNFEDGAVRAAAAVLRGRLDERVPVSAGAARDATEGS